VRRKQASNLGIHLHLNQLCQQQGDLPLFGAVFDLGLCNMLFDLRLSFFTAACCKHAAENFLR
jgi:hypothetical protein